jgi:hypothetical protein
MKSQRPCSQSPKDLRAEGMSDNPKRRFEDTHDDKRVQCYAHDERNCVIEQHDKDLAGIKASVKVSAVILGAVFTMCSTIVSIYMNNLTFEMREFKAFAAVSSVDRASMRVEIDGLKRRIDDVEDRHKATDMKRGDYK